MLTLAYCRVSTEEQAEEGYSIEGQADKLRAYATLRDLGESRSSPTRDDPARTWSAPVSSNSWRPSRRAT